MIVLLLNFIGLCFSIFIIVIVILTWTNTNKLVHSEPFIAGEASGSSIHCDYSDCVKCGNMCEVINKVKIGNEIYTCPHPPTCTIR